MTRLCTELSSLCWIATGGRPFGEYHSSSAALGQQRPEVTKQPLVCDWLATSETLLMLNRFKTLSMPFPFVLTVGPCWLMQLHHHWDSHPEVSVDIFLFVSEHLQSCVYFIIVVLESALTETLICNNYGSCTL